MMELYIRFLELIGFERVQKKTLLSVKDCDVDVDTPHVFDEIFGGACANIKEV